jgi:hypothetical protein
LAAAPEDLAGAALTAANRAAVTKLLREMSISGPPAAYKPQMNLGKAFTRSLGAHPPLKTRLTKYRPARARPMRLRDWGLMLKARARTKVSNRAFSVKLALLPSACPRLNAVPVRGVFAGRDATATAT